MHHNLHSSNLSQDDYPFSIKSKYLFISCLSILCIMQYELCIRKDGSFLLPKMTTGILFRTPTPNLGDL